MLKRRWPSAIASALAAAALFSVLLLLHRPRKPAAAPFFLASPGSDARIESGALWSETVKVEWKACPWWGHGAHRLPVPLESTGYIKVECTGGLNQMRRDLCDGVGIARLLNATLLIPHFDAASYWNDSSGFADIFDVDFFINQTKGYVHVVKELPEDLRNVQPIRVNCIKRRSPFDYVEEVLPVLMKNKVVILRPAASQRSDRYPFYAKAARCRACYRALKLQKFLEDQAKEIMSKIPRPFMALHLRFEPDMIAYSQCEYPTLSSSSAMAVEAVRDSSSRAAFVGDVERAWRKRGKCLLTPSDVAFILCSLNMAREMPIYLATGDGLLEAQGFTEVFPNTYNKSFLLGEEALRKLGSNGKAALDFYISVNSDYYVASYFGNMEKMVLPLRVLERNWNNLVLDKKDYAIAASSGSSTRALKDRMWKTHRDAFSMARGLALPDCFCEQVVSF